MKPHQEKFYTFILERVQEEKKAEAESLLKESFERQDNGTFHLEFLQGFEISMAECLKPECKEEVQKIMENFKMQFRK